MNFQFYLEKLFENKSFQEFKKENKKAFPCSCFFVIDKKGKDNKQHFDYFVPEDKKLFSFKMESGGEKVPVDLLDDKIPNEIDLNYNFDFNDIEKIIYDEMEKKSIKGNIEKMLFSLQKVKGEDLLVGTVFLPRMALLQVHVNIAGMKVILLEKKSFFDIVKFKGKKD